MTPTNEDATVVLRGMAGAAIGAVVGWFAVGWLIGEGFYGLALPGALVGLICGALSGGASLVNAILCAIIAVGLGVALEWRHFPFVADESFGYFVAHLHQLKGMTWLMLALGAVFAFWFGRGSNRSASHRRAGA